eukprot:g4044.t1
MFKKRTTLCRSVFVFSLLLFLTYSAPVFPIRVTNCTALYRALASPSISYFEVTGAFICDTTAWTAPVVVDRDLRITGRILNGTHPKIDWGFSSGGVVAGVDCHIVFDSLIFLQRAMGIDQIDVPFLYTRENATVHFASVVIGVESCPHSLDNERVLNLSRPYTFAGSQSSTQIDNDTISATDIAIQWSGRNSASHFFQTIIACNVYRNAPELDLYYTEITGDDSDAYEVEIRNDDDEMEDQNPGSSSSEGPDLALTALIAAFGLAALLVIISFGFIGRRRARWDQDAMNTGISQSFEEEEEKCNCTKPGPSSEAWNLLDSDVSLEAPLGHGEFGKVYKASWQGTTVAVKIIKHNDQYLKTNVGGALFEAFIAKHISHPNVVQTYQISTKNPSPDAHSRSLLAPSETMSQRGADKHDKGSRSDSCSSEEMFGCFDEQEASSHIGGMRYETWIVLEYCDGGSLAQAINNGEFLLYNENQPGYKMRNIAKTALEIAGAMNYLHSVRIIHGDLKPGNVLLRKDASDPRGFICKVGDFGLSKFLAEDSHLETFTCGTVTHMPPELLNEGKLSSASDVYSFGILLWEILSRKKPFAGKNHTEIILSVVNKRMRPVLPPNVPEDFSNLIQSCWTHEYTQRPTFPDIIDTLTVILKYYTKLERNETGTRPPPDALDTAGTVPRSSFFTVEDIERAELPSIGLHSEHKRKSFRIVPKRFSSLKGNRLTQTINTAAAATVAVAAESSSTDVVVSVETNKSLHWSLNGKQNSIEQTLSQEEPAMDHSAESIDSRVGD